MKKTFRLIAAIALTAAMCLSLCVEGLAADEDNVTVSAVLDVDSIDLGGQDGTVYLTLSMSAQHAIDSAEFVLISDIPGFSVSSPTNTPDGFMEFDKDSHAYSWMAASDVTVDALGTFAITIPADTEPGKYSIGFKNMNLSANMEYWKEEASGSTQLEIIGMASGPQFEKHSLVLSGEIGVNFFMKLPGDADDYTESFVRFTVGEKSIDCAFDPQFTDVSGTLYGFTCYVNSVQMADIIHAEFNWDGGAVEQDYSVAQYVEEYRKVSGEYDETVGALVEAMADYGHFAQIFLAEANGWTVGVEHAAMKVNAISAYTQEQKTDAADGLENYEITRDCSDSEVEKVLVSLTMDSSTDINLLLELSGDFSGPVTCSVNNWESFSTSRSGDRYRIKLKGIPAKRLGEEYLVDVSAGGNFTIAVSALSYANALLKSEIYGTQESAVNAATALYRYCRAAEAYALAQ
ncbi:MAG: hypothetical protein IKE62_00915 [Oscillospiraceae bacterium]|nr:hypothetical protein [Oscillospiraceae bacterium]